ncbi:SLATT domain-containing protein [Sulfurimonas sp.]
MNFSDRVWKTRKSRINASERLKLNDFISQVLITYYSLFIIVITIVDMKNNDINFEVLTLILSILILVISVFIFAMNYKERSLRLQNTYIKIDKISREISKKEKANEDLSELERQYDEILECSENHSSCDYIQVLFEIKDDENYKKENQPFTFISWVSFIWCKAKKVLYMLILFAIPIITLLSIL